MRAVRATRALSCIMTPPPMVQRFPRVLYSRTQGNPFSGFEKVSTRGTSVSVGGAVRILFWDFVRVLYWPSVAGLALLCITSMYFSAVFSCTCGVV